MATTTADENWFDINYMEQTIYHTHFIPLLHNERVANYCKKQLYRSLTHIGFSKIFCHSLIPNLLHLDFDAFHKNFYVEVNTVRNGKYVPVMKTQYFAEKIIPSIPSSNLVLDIGYGQGVLVKQLASSNRFEKIVGCDWNSCPDWEDVIGQYPDKVEFYTVRDHTLSSFIQAHSPDVSVLTWVLRHMKLFCAVQVYQNSVRHYEFITFSHEERQDVLAIYGWIGNIFLSRRAMPIPASCRTMEDWQSFFLNIGFDIL